MHGGIDLDRLQLTQRLGAMYTPWISDVLRIQPVSLQMWFELLTIAFSVFIASELHKYYWYRLTRHVSP